MISVVLWTALYLIVMETDMTSCHVFEPCTSNNCDKQYDGSKNYDEIETLYRGIFFTEDEILQRSKDKASRRHNKLNKSMYVHKKSRTEHEHQSERTSCIQKKTQQSKRSKSRLETYTMIMTSKYKSNTGMPSMEMESEIYCEAEVGFQKSLPGDGDACCATFTTYNNKTVTMRNIHGAMKTLVHLLNPPRYQIIPYGICGDYGTWCQGVCFQEMIVLPLLVWDDNAKSWPPLTFDRFEIPGYCSCKNVK